jgi:methionine synthase II (cobalamin-independent)
VGTGYGRYKVTFGNTQVTEISCHGRGAVQMFPATRTVVDMGGQDTKAIRVSPNGEIVDFCMNDKCAAGTGRFLGAASAALRIPLSALGPTALRGERPVKISIPGPFAMTSFMRPVEHYRDRPHLAEAFVPAINAEIRRLAEVGATLIQIDEPATPGYGYDPHKPADIARLFNQCVEGVSGVKLGLHICFGTFRKIPYAKRSYEDYFPDLLEAKVDQFLFEFANREMSQIERWPSWAPDRELCAGIIDVRTHYLETPEDVAERARICLEHVPADKLSFSPDCGLRYVARWLAFGKLKALAAGVGIVRRELSS